MTRLVASLAATTVLLAGCSGSGARTVLDPFSRTRVEPPRTGCILGQPTDPYYSGTRQAALPNPPATQPGPWTPASATTPASTTPSRSTMTPTSGHSYPGAASADDDGRASVQKEVSLLTGGPGDRIAIPVAATSSAVATTDALGPGPDGGSRQAAAATSRDMSAGPDRIVRTIQPRQTPPDDASFGSAAGTAPSVGEEPGRLVLPQRVIDIMDLPPPGSTHGSQSASRRGRGAIQLASATTEESSRGSAALYQGGTPRSASMGDKPRDSFSSQASYGHDPEYRWLRGRLEYSEIDRRWKLRYIPIDGVTDDFGGSVVLADASQLSGYERGQIVEVHGALGHPPENADRGYAPEFQIREIQRPGT